MKIVKYLAVFLLTVVSIIFLASCREFCVDKLQKPPADVSAINWDDYNDVYTVFWNYYGYCPRKSKEVPDNGKEIMISGWISRNGDIPEISTRHFFLVDESNLNVRKFPNVVISFPIGDLIMALDTFDLKKKCFIKGRLDLWCEPGGGSNCIIRTPVIILKNVDNINFK